jgi:hypothetical protein
MMSLVHRRHCRDEGDDSLALYWQCKLHTGIAYGAPPTLQIGEDPSRTVVDLAVMALEEMKNHVKFEQGSFR